MLRRSNYWLVALLLIMMSRFVGMMLFPLADTTEPRYAETARLMAETGDWITPWFEPGVPFWGKPPLSFWAQAAAIKLFGLSEFSLRLPAWVVTFGIIGLVWRLAKALFGAKAAQWSSLIFATMLLTYISAGAVMTDTFLALGTTLSLVSFYLVRLGHSDYWRWGFFVGIVIGLLAKGPLTLVLVGMPIFLWLVITRQGFSCLGRLPWWRGIALTLLLICPWYVLAELKTPGFLNYFIVGEHLLRFLNPGWGGDLYGSAHKQPLGMIWIYWLQASFPWGVFLLLGLLVNWLRDGSVRRKQKVLLSHDAWFLLLSALTPMLFFTFASNILWTYILPSLPFSALLIGHWVTQGDSSVLARMRRLTVALTPVSLTVVVILVAMGSIPLKTEKELVNSYFLNHKEKDSPLVYLHTLPFSARFYSQGKAIKLTEQELIALSKENEFQQIYVAVSKNESESILANIPFVFRTVMENRRYKLLVTETY